MIVRFMNGTSETVFRRKAVTQGEPLDMMDYGLVVPHHIKYIQEVFPDVHQSWYIYDASSGGWFT